MRARRRHSRKPLLPLSLVHAYVVTSTGADGCYRWANQICADDHQERAVVLASMNMWNNVINAWWPLVFYPATDAPRFTKGMWAMIGTCLATLAVTWLVWYLERREKRGRVQQVTDGAAAEKRPTVGGEDEKSVRSHAGSSRRSQESA